MDKNTLTGIVLIALLFLGFMWLTPKSEPAAQQITQNAETSQTIQYTGTDSLTVSELGWLKENVRSNGKAVYSDSVATATLSGKNYNISLRGETLSGTITLDGVVLNITDVLNKNLSVMSVEQQRKAIELIKQTINTVGQYGKFAQFLSGNDSVICLENEALALQISSKAGTISRAELKQYESEYNVEETDTTKHKVVLFENETNNLSYVINVPQALNTDDFYFTPKQVNDSTVLMTLDIAEDAYWGIKYTLPKGENYVVKIDIVQKNLDKVLHSNNPTMGVNWTQQMVMTVKSVKLK